MPTPWSQPPILAPNGKPWNIFMLMGDDWMLDSYEGMPLFQANWASGYTRYPNGSTNMPLCFPGRAATYTGWRVERHGVASNEQGADYVAGGAIDHTIFTNLARAGYYTGMVGKIYNLLGANRTGGWGELPWVHPGVHFMRGQWGDVDYFNWDEIDETGAIIDNHGAVDTNTTGTDYAIDVERLRILEFFDSVPSGRPWLMVQSSKGTHAEEGENGPPARYASAAVNIVTDPGFGIEPLSAGVPSWANGVAYLPWNANKATKLINEHTESLRVTLALDECLDTVFQSLVARGWDQNTLVIIKTDNAHASGELCFNKKGIPHRSATNMLLAVKVPGVAGGVSYAPVSDIDIAPFIYSMTGVRPMITPHGMCFANTLLDKSHPHRLAAPITNTEDDTPLFRAVQFGGNPGRIYYRILPTSAYGPGQTGGFADAAQTKNAVVAGDAAVLAATEPVNY